MNRVPNVKAHFLILFLRPKDLGPRPHVEMTVDMMFLRIWAARDIAANSLKFGGAIERLHDLFNDAINTHIVGQSEIWKSTKKWLGNGLEIDRMNRRNTNGIHSLALNR